MPLQSSRQGGPWPTTSGRGRGRAAGRRGRAGWVIDRPRATGGLAASAPGGRLSLGWSRPRARGETAAGQCSIAALQDDLAYPQRPVAWLQDGFAWLQNGFAWLQNDFAWLQNDFAWLQNDFARGVGGGAGAAGAILSDANWAGEISGVFPARS